ncbi:MAG: hypothetical protein WDN67_05360 [Candidatus Moraniibacteriota bacterium]
MFLLIRLIIWVAGIAVAGYVVLHFFGYNMNWHYFDQSKAVCEEYLSACRKELIQNGVNGAKENCEFQCIDPRFLIQKP